MVLRKLMALAFLAILVLPLASSEGATDLERYLDCLTDKKVDIVFVFDTSGSMSGEINELSAIARDFATDLEASHIDHLLGLVEFRDFPKTCGESKVTPCGELGDFAYRAKGDGNLTGDIDIFRSWLKELKASGGADDPEAILAALRHAGSDLQWRSDAEKVMILVTDATAHPDGDCCNAEGDTLDGTIYNLAGDGARVYVIGPDDAALQRIAGETGGQLFRIRSGLSLKPLLKEITGAMSCSFKVEAETTCLNKTLKAKVQLVGKEVIPYVAGQTEAWMYLDQSGNKSRYNLSYDQTAGAYLVNVPDVCGPVELTVYGRVGERSAVQTTQVECETCGAAAATEQGTLSISGRVFNDSNGDGVKGTDEAGLENWGVLLDGPEGYSATAKTDKKGYYIFTGLLHGSYRLGAIAPGNWTSTAPAEGVQVVKLVDTHESEIDFGFRSPLISEANQSRPEVVIFPDPNLDAAIRAAINKPEGDIHPADLDGLNDFDAGKKDIKNIAGMEYCDNLEELGLYDNQITDVSPLSGLTNLTQLTLGVNQITNISPLSGLTNLTWLSLYGNQITDVSPLSGLTNLDDLSLEGNQITDVSPLSGLTKLTTLNLHINQIIDISSLSGLTNLENLYLAYNQITDISSLSGLTKLEKLDLRSNQITDVSPLSGLTKLNIDQ